MRAADSADPVRAKAAAVERLGDESPAMTNPTKSLDDTLPVRAHTKDAAIRELRVHRGPKWDSCP